MTFIEKIKGNKLQSIFFNKLECMRSEPKPFSLRWLCVLGKSLTRDFIGRSEHHGM